MGAGTKARFVTIAAAAVMAVLVAPAAGSAQQSANHDPRCGRLGQATHITGPTCAVARSVVRAYERCLSTPGCGPVHSVVVRGRRWRISSHKKAVGGGSFEMFDRATHAGQVVTWRELAAN